MVTELLVGLLCLFHPTSVLHLFSPIQCEPVVDDASKVFRWFWTFSWIIMFNPSNFCITFDFTNVMLTARRIPFINKTLFFICFYLLKEIRVVYFYYISIFLVLQVITILKLLSVNLQYIFKNCFDLISLSPQLECVNEYERFCDFKPTSWNYKAFISTLFTLLKFVNYFVHET